MTTVYYFSGSGKTKEVATFVANELNFPLKEISENKHDCQDAAVVVFPVYCQNIPKPVYNFLKKLDTEKIALIATYGRISHGNVLKECELVLKGKIIAAVYLPCNHSYLSDECDFSKDDLKSIIAKIKQSNQSDCVKILKSKKSVFADFFPALRSRISVKISKTSDCTNCGKCDGVCPIGAMKNGKPNDKCIRCLKCIKSCPNHALTVKYSRTLTNYLKRRYDPNRKAEIYV